MNFKSNAQRKAVMSRISKKYAPVKHANYLWKPIYKGEIVRYHSNSGKIINGEVVRIDKKSYSVPLIIIEDINTGEKLAVQESMLERHYEEE
jgi:hypothetical protein